MPYGVLEPNGYPISDPSFSARIIRIGQFIAKPSMSQFAVPWATARLCLCISSACAAIQPHCPPHSHIASQHKDTASQQRYKRRLRRGPSCLLSRLSRRSSPTHEKGNQGNRLFASHGTSRHLPERDHNSNWIARYAYIRYFHPSNLHTAHAYCQLQIRNVDRARFDGRRPLFPTAPLLSEPMCPEGDRSGSFRTRCWIVPQLPANGAMSTVERRASPVCSEEHRQRQSARPSRYGKRGIHVATSGRDLRPPRRSHPARAPPAQPAPRAPRFPRR